MNHPSEKLHLKHISELALIGGVAKLKLAEGVNRGRLKSQLKRLQKAVDNDLDKCVDIDQGDIDVIWNIVSKFTHDTGWANKTLHTVTLVQFCKALIAQSDKPFSLRVQGVLDDIENYYDRVGKLQGPNMWAADLACRRWLSIWGIHESGPSSEDRLKAATEIVTRQIALDEYREKFYPERKSA